jgi:hypothetical protein
MFNPIKVGIRAHADGSHKFAIERLPNSDALLVRRDHGESIIIPMTMLAQGKTIAEAYEELLDGEG